MYVLKLLLSLLVSSHIIVMKNRYRILFACKLIIHVLNTVSSYLASEYLT